MVSESILHEKHHAVELRFHVRRYRENHKLPDLLFLHGFMGSGMQFEHLFAEISDFVNPVTADVDVSIPGTPAGSSGCLVEPLIKGLHRIVTGLLNGGDHFHLPFVAGYSMGGRLALSWATRLPGHISGLVLESTTAGISDDQERELRKMRDVKNAKHIRTDFAAFLDNWEKNPLFQISDAGNAISDQNDNKTGKNLANLSGKSAALKRLESIQQEHQAKTAAAWLTGFGTGVMPPVWDQLSRITSPVLLVTGRMDSKFCDIAYRMSQKLPDANHVILPDAAHRVHIDSPDLYISTLRDFINTCSKSN